MWRQILSFIISLLLTVTVMYWTPNGQSSVSADFARYGETAVSLYNKSEWGLRAPVGLYDGKWYSYIGPVVFRYLIPNANIIKVEHN